MMPDLWDDALQEGMIQAWRDVEAGIEPKLKVLRRASMHAQGFFQRNGEYFFGKPKKSRDGLRHNSATLDKVQTYLEEFMPVHRRFPTGVETSNALGIKQSAATMALRHIREGRIDHMKYHNTYIDGARRKDFSYYSSVSIQTLEGTESANRTWEDNPLVPLQLNDFETDSISYMDLITALKKLAPDYQTTLYLYLFEQYNSGDIGRHWQGRLDTASQRGTKRIDSALNQMRMVLGIYDGKCNKGHNRNEDNSEIVQFKDGTYYYYCKICKNRPSGPGNKGPVKDTIGSPCGNGHTKDKINNKGYARCSVCMKLAQREYRERKKNAASD